MSKNIGKCGFCKIPCGYDHCEFSSDWNNQIMKSLSETDEQEIFDLAQPIWQNDSKARVGRAWVQAILVFLKNKGYRLSK